MINKLVTIAFVVLLAVTSGCAKRNHLNPVEGKFNEALDTSESSVETKNVVAVETTVPMQGQLKPLDGIANKPADSKESVITTENDLVKHDVDIIEQPSPLAVPSKENMAHLGESNFEALLKTVKKPSLETPTSIFKRKARVAPTSAPTGWINAITVFDFMDGALYQIYTSPGHTTDIMMQPGEQIISQAAGDTFRWKVDVTSSGSGSDERQHIIVKPTHPNIETNLIITTDKRVYYAEMHSQENGAYMAGCSWNYPNDYFVTRYNTVKKSKEEQEKDIAISDLSKLNFDYKLESNNAEWVPIRVFDNGKKTYIQFPHDMKYREAPVLFVLSKKGVHQIVNYRKKEDYYIVDRLFARAELREGQRDQDIVRITNGKLDAGEHSTDSLDSNERSIEGGRNGN